MNKVIVKMMVLTLLIFSVLGNSHAMGQFMVMENPLKGKPAPDFTLMTSQGKSATLAEMRAGNPAIVFFWATWCPHCREQLGELKAKEAVMKEKGINVILVDVQEKAELVNAHMRKIGVDLPVVLDHDGEVANKYAIVGVPTFYLLDKDGIVREVEHSLPANYEEIMSPKG